ncbi:YhbY family RNA-binding protein [Candidatus Woesearchaeota archaeon]|nr:YhbY family RNA-binding protein [Candidatus Woesearchaeota archaeon]
MLTLRKLRKESQQLRPTLQIGKAGVTESVAAEITLQLKKKKIIKIKILNNILEHSDRGALIQSILTATPSVLVQEKGNILTLSYKAQDIKAKKPGETR